MVEGPPVSYIEKLRKFLPKEEGRDKILAGTGIFIVTTAFYALTHDKSLTTGFAAVAVLYVFSYFRNRGFEPKEITVIEYKQR